MHDCYSDVMFIFINLPVFNYLEKESECLQLKIWCLNELERQKKALGWEAVLLHKEQVALQDKVSEGLT